jgi:hypothetical protein
MTLKSIQPDDWPDRIHANKAVIRFPNGVESGNWQTKPADDTCEYVRALPAAPAEDVRAGAQAQDLCPECKEPSSWGDEACPMCLDRREEQTGRDLRAQERTRRVKPRALINEAKP